MVFFFACRPDWPSIVVRYCPGLLLSLDHMLFLYLIFALVVANAPCMVDLRNVRSRRYVRIVLRVSQPSSNAYYWHDLTVQVYVPEDE